MDDNDIDMVEIDYRFPAAVLDTLLDQLGPLFKNGGKVVIGVGDINALYACGDKHVHVEFTFASPLAEISGMTVIAFAVGLICDRRKDWRPKPTSDEIKAVIDEMLAMPGLEPIRFTLLQARENAVEVLRDMKAGQRALN